MKKKKDNKSFKLVSLEPTPPEELDNERNAEAKASETKSEDTKAD